MDRNDGNLVILLQSWTKNEPKISNKDEKCNFKVEYNLTKPQEQILQFTLYTKRGQINCEYVLAYESIFDKHT